MGKFWGKISFPFALIAKQESFTCFKTSLEVRCKMYFNKLRENVLRYDKREKDRRGKKVSFHCFRVKGRNKWEKSFSAKGWRGNFVRFADDFWWQTDGGVWREDSRFVRL
jgi:hypothetical protein